MKQIKSEEDVVSELSKEIKEELKKTFDILEVLEEEFDEFVIYNVLKIIDKYEYDIFPIELPIDFDSIIDSVFDKEHKYGIRVETDCDDYGSQHVLFFEDEIISVMEQKYNYD